MPTVQAIGFCKWFMPMVQVIDTMILVGVVNGLSGEAFEMQVPEHARISGLKGGIARETLIPTVFQQLLVDNVKGVWSLRGCS